MNYEKDIVNNPIKLLCAIKEHALNFQYRKYPMVIIMDAFRVFHPRDRGKGLFVNTSQQTSDNVSVTTNQSRRTENVPAETPSVGTIPERNG
jgi:hypothetical protein